MKILVIAAALTALFAAQTHNGDAIRDRLDKYLFAYEPQLSSVVADEQRQRSFNVLRVATCRA